MTTAQNLTHRQPRITELTFGHALVEGPHVFSGSVEAGAIWSTLLHFGVDPSFMLGQFYAESFFGTAGFAVDAQKAGTPLHAIGNILAANSPLLAKDMVGVTRYTDLSGTYTFARYASWALGALDYCLLLQDYVLNHDPRYGDSGIIYNATARWAGQALGSTAHINYLNAITGRMDNYDARPPWRSTEMAIEAPVGVVPSSNAHYAARAGDLWYARPADTVGITGKFGAAADVTFLGYPRDAPGWCAVVVHTGNLTGTIIAAVVYMPFDPLRLKIG